MKQLILVFVLLAASFVAPAQAQQILRQTPIWEGHQKSDAEKALDAELIEKAKQLTGGDLKRAGEQAVQLGWAEIGKGHPEAAIRRLNQAWLFDPDNAGIYWGFAVATHMRNDPLETVLRWFDEAAKRIGDNARLLADRGRVFDERGLPGRARPLFERAIELDPSHLPAHIGMMRVAKAIGDDALYDKHKEVHDTLTR